MLHVHNGDCSAVTARNAGVPGEHFAWREALVDGPVPGDLAADEFVNVRAAYLAAAYGASLEKCQRDLKKQLDVLAQFRSHEEVVLWFEHDLFCQVHLVYLLNWFAHHEAGDTRLTLICIGEFPGIQLFHGLGQLTERQLASLFPQRLEVTPEQLRLGEATWRAYSSPDALGLIALRDADTSPLPFLKTAVERHLQRFPHTRNGLGRVENTALELIAGGHREFRSLFPAFIRREGEYGFGDAQVFVALQRLTDAPAPLLKKTVNGASAMDPTAVIRSAFEINDFGRAVLAGDEDFVVQNGIDLWLGGVHLLGPEAQWRWDGDTEQLLVSL